MPDQETRHVWAEPTPEQVLPGIWRLALPLPLDGLSAVNVYVLEGPDGLVLVDAGWAWEPGEEALRVGLGALGHAVETIALFVITHAHWDHYSLAAGLRGRYDVAIAAGAGERHTFESFDEATTGLYPGQTLILRACGAHALADLITELEPEEFERGVPFDPPDLWLQDGDVIPLRHGALEVVATPGHTRGHVVLRHTETSALFTGDHVLPGITPAIGIEAYPPDSALADYLDSLRLLLDLPDGTLLPAHGPVSGSTHARVEELLAHHEERLESVREHVAAGHQTAHDVAAAMPWTTKRRQLRDLRPVHQMSAVVEVAAHLHVLADRGHVVERKGGGVRRFSAEA